MKSHIAQLVNSILQRDLKMIANYTLPPNLTCDKRDADSNCECGEPGSVTMQDPITLTRSCLCESCTSDLTRAWINNTRVLKLATRSAINYTFEIADIKLSGREYECWMCFGYISPFYVVLSHEHTVDICCKCRISTTVQIHLQRYQLILLALATTTLLPELQWYCMTTFITAITR